MIVESDNQYWALKAPVFRSYTIARLINEGNAIRIFDDYDLVRENKKGTLINVSKVHHFALEQLVERSREAAENYSGGYFLLERDELTPNTQRRLYEILRDIPFP